MKINFEDKLVIAISSRSLFDLDESHTLFEQEGIEAYEEYQRANEHNILAPGAAFPLVKKLLRLNEGRTPECALVEIILLSRNTADTGLRIFHSIEHYNLAITRAAFSGGKSPYVYTKGFGAHLYLSLNTNDVKQAILSGCPAATIWPAAPENNITGNNIQNSANDNTLNIAFDGDAVLFSDEAERIFKAQGLAAFHDSEKQAAHSPLTQGPFKRFLMALHKLQNENNLPIAIRTALVTARSAPAHERVIHTLREWGIRIDESIFLGGLPKTEFLEAFGADIFFDDQTSHLNETSTKITSAHVPYGIANQ